MKIQDCDSRLIDYWLDDLEDQQPTDLVSFDLPDTTKIVEGIHEDD